MKLYHRPKTSGRPMHAAWLLEELGADYETVPIEDTDSDEHPERSPLGRVPVLEFDGGTMLFDSAPLSRWPNTAPPGDRSKPDRDHLALGPSGRPPMNVEVGGRSS